MVRISVDSRGRFRGGEPDLDGALPYVRFNLRGSGILLGDRGMNDT